MDNSDEEFLLFQVCSFDFLGILVRGR
jgi:hypothetical protein